MLRWNEHFGDRIVSVECRCSSLQVGCLMEATSGRVLSPHLFILSEIMVCDHTNIHLNKSQMIRELCKRQFLSSLCEISFSSLVFVFSYWSSSGLKLFLFF